MRPDRALAAETTTDIRTYDADMILGYPQHLAQGDLRAGNVLGRIEDGQATIRPIRERGVRFHGIMMLHRRHVRSGHLATSLVHGRSAADRVRLLAVDLPGRV